MRSEACETNIIIYELVRSAHIPDDIDVDIKLAYMIMMNNDKMVHFLCQYLFSERFTGHIELHFIYELLWRASLLHYAHAFNMMILMMMIQLDWTGIWYWMAQHFGALRSFHSIGYSLRDFSRSLSSSHNTISWHFTMVPNKKPMSTFDTRTRISFLQSLVSGREREFIHSISYF